MVASSNVEAIGYSIERNMMFIQFKGGSMYKYMNVPKSVYDEMMVSTSIGSYVSKHVKNSFNYGKAEPEDLFDQEVTSLGDEMDAFPEEKLGLVSGEEPQGYFDIESHAVPELPVMKAADITGVIRKNRLDQERPPETLFVVDLSWLHSRSKFAFKELTWRIDNVTYATGTIYGVFDALATVIERFGKNVHIILAMDGKPVKHERLTGAYKAGRDVAVGMDVVHLTRWDAAKQMTILPQVTIMHHPSMEGDETMGFIAKTKRKQDTVILFSGDGDMRQLIDSKNKVYCAYEYSRGKGFVIEDEQHLYSQGIKDLAGLKPESVALHLAIVGDSSDGIHGIPRFLKAVSKDISNNCMTLDGLKSLIEANTVTDAKMKKALVTLQENMVQLELNWKLTNIDPLFIPNMYTYENYTTEEVGLWWFDRYGCSKIYNDIIALLG